MTQFTPPPAMKIDEDFVYIPLYIGGMLKIHKSRIAELGAELVPDPGDDG